MVKSFATATAERVIVAGHPVEVTRTKITDAGRVELLMAKQTPQSNAATLTRLELSYRP